MNRQTGNPRNNPKGRWLAGLVVAAWIAVALGLRAVFLPIESYDMRAFLEPWYDFIVAHGHFAAFQYAFSDYSPAYLYLLSLATFVTWLPKITAIKLISTIFDFSAAFAVQQIIKQQTGKTRPAWIGFIAVLYLPTVFIESAWIGQCDIIFTSFLLWMVYALMRGKNIQAMLFFSIALAFKLQAAFLAPLILVFFLVRKIKPAWILLPIGFYLLSIFPAWLAGRPLHDLLLVYFSQTGAYHFLSLSAPNIYYLFSDPSYYSTAAVLIGLVLAAIFSLVYLFFRWQKKTVLKSRVLVEDASLLGFIYPFVLPMMHDRYFFTAALFLLVLALLDRKMIWPAILLQATSIISYIEAFHILMIPAMIINLGIAVWLCLNFVTSLKSQGKNTSNAPLTT